MGQYTHALLFGAQVPDLASLYTDDCDGVMDCWRGLPDCPEHVVRWPDDTDLLGVVIAAGASGVDDTEDLGAPVALDALDRTEPYATALGVAASRWKAFAAWCAEQGVTLPAARVWLVSLEVA